MQCAPDLSSFRVTARVARSSHCQDSSGCHAFGHHVFMRAGAHLVRLDGESTMDPLIWTAWRAFWVALGASAVIIAQTLLARAPNTSLPQVPPSVLEPTSAEAASPASTRSDPVLLHRPF